MGFVSEIIENMMESGDNVCDFLLFPPSFKMLYFLEVVKAGHGMEMPLPCDHIFLTLKKRKL